MSTRKKKATPVSELGYEEAMADLEKILEELEAEDSDLDNLAERVRRASELVRHCRDKIHQTEMEVEKVLKELPEADEGEGEDEEGLPF
jgi:exodeoxyribonuclease VII small subunit